MGERGGEVKHIKICLLGSEKVGKTWLAHKLVDCDYDQSRPVAECQQFIRELSEKRQILIYYDFPSIRAGLIQELTRDHVFDMMVCLFKDSASFGQLYEFFEAISRQTEQGERSFNDYWEGIRHIVLVYSEFEEQAQVQLEQLFNLLSEQVRNFNRTATIKQFVLKPQLANAQYLRYLIEKNRFEEHVSQELIPSPETENAQGQSVSAMVTEVAATHSLQGGKEHEFKAIERENEEDWDAPELTDVKLTSTKEKLLTSEHSIQEHDNIATLGKNIEETKYDNNAFTIEVQKQSSPLKDQQVEEEQKHQSKQQLKLLANAPNQDEVEPSSEEKEKQHYQQVFDRLLQKVNSEEIQQSKKASYKDLFEEFRRTSKNESKISKQLHDYWQYKIEKLEEEDEDDEEEPPEIEEGEDGEEEEEERQVEPIKQQKAHLHSAPHHGKKRGSPLKPHTSYEDGKPKREKSSKDSNSCFCEVM